MKRVLLLAASALMLTAFVPEPTMPKVVASGSGVAWCAARFMPTRAATAWFVGHLRAARRDAHADDLGDASAGCHELDLLPVEGRIGWTTLSLNSPGNCWMAASLDCRIESSG